MKKFTLLLLCFFVASAGFAQDDLENFEGYTVGATIPFVNGPGSATVIADPTPGAPNGNVLEVITAAASAPWQQAELTFQPGFELNLSLPDKTVLVDWYSATPFDALIRVESGVGGGDSAAQAIHTGTGWETLSFDFNNPQDGLGVPTGVYGEIFFFNLWDAPDANMDNIPDATPAGTWVCGAPTCSPVVTTLVDLIQGPEAPSCTTTLGATSATCETTTGIGATDDTYSATIGFSDGLNGNVYVVTANSGTVSGDDPNVVASGTITVTGITEGTDLMLTVSDVAGGGDCDLSTTVTSPSCAPLPTLTVLEDFEPVAPSLTFTNGTGSATVIPDPTMDSRGGVLEIITADAQAPWQQAELVLQDFDLDLTTADKTVFVDWYSDTPFDALLGARTGGPAADAQAIHTGTGWETLEFNFNSPENLLPVANGVYEQLFFFPLWDADAPRPGATGDDGAFLNDGNPNGSIASTTYIDIVQGPAISGPSCNTILGSTSAVCDTTGAGATDDTYTANVNFTGGLSGNVYILTASSGTVGGDDPNVVASGTITVTGITEGTDVTVTVNDLSLIHI